MSRAVLKYEFNLRELSGAMGDFGTLIPLMAGYIVVCGLDPAALFITVGLVSIITGAVFKLPIPIEPMKVIAVVAIAQAWSPSMVYASGFVMGIIWIILSISGFIEIISRYTPKPVIRGIQVALGIMLIMQAFNLVSSWWVLGIAALILAVLLRNNPYAPAVLVLMLAGIALSVYQGIPAVEIGVKFTAPVFTSFNAADLWPVMLLAGFAQVPLTATNAVLSTQSLIKSYWPETSIKAKNISLSIGIINLVIPFMGGMPICHGAGGLTAKYLFGARTGGGNILLGVIEVLAGLFFASVIALVFSNFPEAIIGALLFLIGFELVKFARDIARDWNIIILAITVVLSVVVNMAIGFITGLAAYYIIEYTGSFRKQQ